MLMQRALLSLTAASTLRSNLNSPIHLFLIIMKRYYKPTTKEIYLDGELILAGSINDEGTDAGQLSKRQGLIIDDEEDF